MDRGRGVSKQKCRLLQHNTHMSANRSWSHGPFPDNWIVDSHSPPKSRFQRRTESHTVPYIIDLLISKHYISLSPIVSVIIFLTEMSFFLGLVMGITVGIGLIVVFVRSENNRSKQRSDLATTIAAFARMTVEDSRKILPSQFYPSWVVFSQRQKATSISFAFSLSTWLVLLSQASSFWSDFLFFSWHGLITISPRSGPMWMRYYFFGFTLWI